MLGIGGGLWWLAADAQQVTVDSNRSCYIKDEMASRVTFTSHAAT